MPPPESRSRIAKWAVRALVLLAVVCAVLVLETRRRMVRLAETHPPLGNLIVVDGVRLHYAMAGGGPPVLLLHGCPGFLQDWQFTVPGETSVFEDLAEDHTVIALDRPGYGWSGTPATGPPLLAAQADLAAAFLAALSVDRSTLVGHSYGASLALAMVVRHPDIVENIVLVGPAMYPEGMRAEPIMRVQTWPAVGAFFRWCISPIVLRPMASAGLVEFFKPDAPPPGYADAFVTFLQRPSAQLQMGTELVHIKPDLAAQTPGYGDITVPITVIYGDLDVPEIAAGVPRLAEAAPHTRVVKLEGIGHEVQHLRPRVVTAEVRRLTQSAGTPASAPTE